MIRIDRVSEESQLINIGPSHPAMHGTIRIAVEVEGEKVLASDVEMGYLHRGFEKTAENKSYPKVIPYTDRLNYCSPLINNHGFALAVEDLLKVEVPERAEILRMITDEMSRITDHLINIGALASESGALTVMLYMMQAREELWKIFELLSGARMTTSYIRIGGVKADAPRGFRPLMERALLRTREVLKEVSRLLDNNPIFLKRTKGIGALTAQEALSYGFTGPLLRANGILYDVRRFSPYSLYPRVEFEIPLGENGDVYDRYRVRMEEMEQSARIIEQGLTLLEGAPPAEIGEETVTAREALEMTKRGDSIEPERISLPPGLKGMEEERHDGILAADHPMIAPSKAQVFNSIEGLVHQFVSVMEGYGIKPPLGEVYRAVEGGNGELGFYLVSDGSDRPYRLHLRAPAFHLMSGLSRMIEGGYLADVIPTFGSINMIGGGGGPMRLGPVLEEKIRTLMGSYEREESALIPALMAVQAEYGCVDSEAAEEVSALFEITPERVEEVLSFYSLLQRSPGGRHRILLCRSLVCSGGAEKILKVLQEEYSLLPGGTSPDGRFSLFLCECLGHCEKAPAIMVDDRVYGPLGEGNLFSLLEGFK